MSTSNTPPKLHIPKDCPHLAYDHGAGGNCHLTAHLGGHAENTLARAVECYNACSGIADPAAAIQAAKDLREALIPFYLFALQFRNRDDILTAVVKHGQQSLIIGAFLQVLETMDKIEGNAACSACPSTFAHPPHDSCPGIPSDAGTPACSSAPDELSTLRQEVFQLYSALNSHDQNEALLNIQRLKQWQRQARSSIVNKAGITDDPDSFIGKTLGLI